MKNFIERYILLKNQKLMVKISVFSSVFIIFPVLSVGLISYKSSTAELEEQFNQSSRQIIQQVESHIEYYVQDFEITSLRMVNSPEFKTLLLEQPSGSQDREELVDSIRDVIHNAEYSRTDISNITVMLENGFVIDTLGQHNYYPAARMEDEYWFPSVPDNGAVMLVSRTLNYKDKQQPVISLVRRLIHPYTLQSVGMLVIDINFRRIQEISTMVALSENGYFFILDQEGHYVYHPDVDKLGKAADFGDQINFDVESGSALIVQDRTQQYVAYSRSQNLGWTFFTAVPYQDLMGSAKQIRSAISYTIVIALLFAYVAGYGFSQSLIRPIRRLQHYMKEVETGNLTGRVKVESNDEIGKLTAGYNNTVEKLSHLLEEVYISKLKEAELSLAKKESELRMLQSQINPHFLYNSLETIRGMAVEGNNENIANMSYSLGKLLRYNIVNQSPVVRLREEMKFCEMYLTIQKFRFEDRFEYSFHVPSWAMELNVVKFSLQPILENCFVHSFGDKFGTIKIGITVHSASESSFTIRIADTGVGMKEEVLEKLTKKLQQNQTAVEDQHIGIMNVHQRIRYLFGPEYGISIRSTLGSGTEVNIHLPKAAVRDG